MKIIILRLLALLLAPCGITYASIYFSYEGDTKNITQITICPVHHIGSMTEKLDTLKLPDNVTVGQKLITLKTYISGSMIASGTVSDSGYGCLYINGIAVSLTIGPSRDTTGFIFSLKNIRKIRFSKDGKILAMETDESSSRATETIKTVMFYCPEGFPQQEITKFVTDRREASR